MELNDIIKSQEDLLEESQKYFDDWYAREEDFRKKLVEED